MEQRLLGKTGRPVSIIGLGTWQLGADWGSVTESDALAVLRAAVESGVTFLDTADVYGDGRSDDHRQVRRHSRALHSNHANRLGPERELVVDPRAHAHLFAELIANRVNRG